MHKVVRVPFCDPRFEVRVIAICKGKIPDARFVYLQNVRNGSAAGRREYEAMLCKYTRLLSDAVAKAIVDPVDALMSPPSDYAWQAEPYREALLARFPQAADLTGCFSRSGEKKAGYKATLADVVSDLTYCHTRHEPDYRRVLIIDDIFNRGVTASAIIEHMRKHGLPEDSEITVVCPQWLEVSCASP